eukprot:6466705-Amphidinium_carterae.3
MKVNNSFIELRTGNSHGDSGLPDFEGHTAWNNNVDHPPAVAGVGHHTPPQGPKNAGTSSGT